MGPVLGGVAGRDARHLAALKARVPEYSKTPKNTRPKSGATQGSYDRAYEE